MKTVVFIMVLATSSGLAAADSAPLLAELLSAQPVRASVLRGGDSAKTAAQNAANPDALLLRVRISRPAEFAPRADADPVFVYNGRAAKMLVNPLKDGVAVLLVEPAAATAGRRALPATSSATLWLAPRGVDPNALSDQQLRELYQTTRRDNPGHVLTVPVPETAP